MERYSLLTERASIPFCFFPQKKFQEEDSNQISDFRPVGTGVGPLFQLTKATANVFPRVKGFSSTFFLDVIQVVRPDLHVKNIPQMQFKHIGVNAPTSRLHLRWIVLKNVIYLYSAKHPHLPPL